MRKYKQLGLGSALVLLLVCALFFVGTQLAVSAGPSDAQTIQRVVPLHDETVTFPWSGQVSGKGREVVALRTENSQTFQLDSGQMRTDLYATDVFYRGDSHDLVPIDNSIIELVSPGDYKYTNEANSWHVYFAGSLHRGDAVKIVKGDHSISTWLVGANPFSTAARSVSVTSPKFEFERELAEDNRAIIYRDALAGVDIAYTGLATALKETIILRHPPESSEFVFGLKLANLVPEVRDGRTVFVDGAGNEVFSIRPLHMEDAAGKYSDAVTCRIERDGASFRVVVSADPSFLRAVDTVYPVRIDPTYDTKGPSHTFDTYTSSTHPSTCYYTSGYLRTGNDGPANYGVRRTYIRFRLPSGYKLGNGTTTGITGATLKLRLHSKEASRSLSVPGP